MSTNITLQIDLPDLNGSLRLAEHIGARLKGGEVIEFASDIGGGKTTLVGGIVRGAGSADRVSSPSFTLTNVYETPNITIYHFDFYRLDTPGILRDEIAEMLADAHNTVIVEWAEIIDDVLPKSRITVVISVTGEASRHYEISYPKHFSYLFADLSI